MNSDNSVWPIPMLKPNDIEMIATFDAALVTSARINAYIDLKTPQHYTQQYLKTIASLIGVN